MKTTLMILGSLLIANIASAQKMNEKDIPVKVKDTFAKKYPGVKAEWEKEGADYEAEFEQNKIEQSVVFDELGTFKEIEQEIKTTELPKAVTDYCTKNYAGYKLSEASKITEASGKLMYEAELTKRKEHFDAIFDDKGVFIKKSEMETEHKKD
ncbi:MAG: PepSY-like domain-containing protein [Bacteroidota bacterium]